MTTIINSNSRVFQIVTSTMKQVFCNLQDIERCKKELGVIDGYYKIYHIWNNKPKLVSKKYLLELYKSNGIQNNNESYFNYYAEQLKSINIESLHPYTVQVTNGEGKKTKHLSINKESAKELINFLNTFL